MSPQPDDDFLDGCDLDFAAASTDDDPELIALFADALDPESDKTVTEAAAEWAELFGDAS